MDNDSIQQKISSLMDERPIPVESVLASIQKSARISDPEDLPIIVKLANMSGLFDETIAVPALASLPAWRVPGLKALRSILENGFHSDGAQRILLTIAAADDLSSVALFNVSKEWIKECRIIVDDELVEEAKKIIRELMLNQVTDVRLRQSLIQNLTFDFILRGKGSEQLPTVEYFLDAFTDTRLLLNRSLIQEFNELLDTAPEREEQLHQFLFDNPILLDPLAVEIKSKHELGSDFVTDFVLKRINDEYVLVEIEKSTDKLFTQKGIFHSELTEAMAQVRDFQAWIHDNIAYAREKLPGIRRPEGLLIIGRRVELDRGLAQKLDEENYSRRGHLKIVTFDDLLEQARVIYNNILSRPIRFKGKKEVTQKILPNKANSADAKSCAAD